MSGEVQDNIWPLPKFYFLVTVDGHDMSFQEVSGLDAEAQAIDYRAGQSGTFSVVKMPGVVKVANVTCKKGIVAKDNWFWDWYSQSKMNTIKRLPVTIKLLDQEGAPTMVWTLNNAWPVKISGTDLKVDGNEIAIETLEFAHEGIVIANG